MIGTIGKSHGVAGEFRVYWETEFPEAYEQAPEFFLRLERGLRGFALERFRLADGTPILKLAGLNSRAAIDALIGTEIYFPIALRPEEEQDEEDPLDVLDFEVLDDALGPLGRVSDVLDRLMQDLLEVKRPDGTTLLIPLEEPLVHAIDEGQKTVRTNLPDGFLDVFTQPDNAEPTQE